MYQAQTWPFPITCLQAVKVLCVNNKAVATVLRLYMNSLEVSANVTGIPALEARTLRSPLAIITFSAVQFLRSTGNEDYDTNMYC
jgi:hypothetical protein